MMHFEYPDDIDEDMIPLMDAMNNLMGISTQFCCSGHSKPSEYDFYILFHCTSIQSLKKIRNAFNHTVSSKNKSDCSSWYVFELVQNDRTPDNALCMRISNNMFNYLTEDERISEITNLTNNIKEQYNI